MKHTLLLASTIAITTLASAQCVPNPLYTDSIFGVWPDTTLNFAPASLNNFYSDTLYLKVPTDAGDLDPSLAGLGLDSVRMNAIAGMPPGINVLCNSQTPAQCTYLTGVLGCGLLEGTPTQEGTFPLTIQVTVFANFFGQPVPFDTAFTGYRIVVGPDVSVAELVAPALSSVRNVPNPFMERTSIEFQLASAGAVDIRVFDLVGAEVRRIQTTGKAGINRIPFNGQGLQPGIYLYKLEAGRSSFTGRMVLHR